MALIGGLIGKPNREALAYELAIRRTDFSTGQPLTAGFMLTRPWRGGPAGFRGAGGQETFIPEMDKGDALNLTEFGFG